MVNLDKLMSPENAAKLRTLGLHKVAAARLGMEGWQLPQGELDLRSAVQILGTHIYEKNAEYRQIAEGLIALRSLTQGE